MAAQETLKRGWEIDENGKRKLTPRLAKRLQPLETVYFAQSSNYRTRVCPDGQWVACATQVHADGAKRRIVPKAFGDDAIRAVEYLETLRTKARDEADKSAAPKTVGDVYDYAVKSVWIGTASTTLRNRKSRWQRYALSYWADRPILEVNRAEAQSWFADRLRVADVPSGQLKELRGELCTLGERFGDIEPKAANLRNPFDGIVLTRRPTREKTTVGREMHSALVRVCGLLTDAGLAQRYAAEMWLTALFTGLRFGETVPLSLEQIDLEKGVLLVDRAMRVDHREIPAGTWQEVGDIKSWALHLPKGGRPDPDPRERRVRRVPISDQAKAVLAPIVERAKASGSQLLWPDDLGQPKAKKNVLLAFETLTERLAEVAKGSEVTRRGRARNIVIEETQRLGIALPDAFDNLIFRDSRNSFTTLCNELAMTDATRDAIMGHLPKGVGAKHYIEITDAALEGARKLLSSH